MAKGQWDIINAEFVTSAVRAEQYPRDFMPEVAFIGRSNVGKSSLINSLCRRRGLARVSSSPGKTQTLNFYKLSAKRTIEEVEDRAEFYLVDLPGYGFAKTNRKNKEQWSAFIRKYLTDAPDLTLVCQLIDIRHKLMPADVEAFKFLTSCGLNVQIVLTKMDKLSRNAAAAQLSSMRQLLGLSSDHIMAYSVTQPNMRMELIDRIMFVLENGAEVVHD